MVPQVPSYVYEKQHLYDISLTYRQGAFAIKLAQISNIHPLICVAGRAQEFVENLIDRSKGDTIVDYRQGNEAVTAGIKAALSAAGFTEAKHAFDGISEKNSYQNIAPALARSGSKLTHVLPLANDSDLPEYIQRSKTYVGTVHCTNISL
jgi:hypothetical protein